MAPSTGVIFSGFTISDKNKTPSPSRNTEMVCVKVTMAPKNAACRIGPREPTKYAATIVLP